MRASHRTETASHNFDVYSQAPDGATPERVEFAGPGDQMPLGFTPDGTALIVNENFKDLGVVRLAQPPTLAPLLHSDANEWIGEVSPDGKWIAYESDESGDRVEIFVRPLSDVTARREKVSIDGGRYPTWSRHGTGELFYVDPNGAMMAASVTLSPSLVFCRIADSDGSNSCDAQAREAPGQGRRIWPRWGLSIQAYERLLHLPQNTR